MFLGSSQPVITNAAVEEAVRSATAATLKSPSLSAIIAQGTTDVLPTMEHDNEATAPNQTFIEDMEPYSNIVHRNDAPPTSDHHSGYAINEEPPLNRVRFFLPERSFDIRSSLTTSSGILDTNEIMDIAMMKKPDQPVQIILTGRQGADDSIVFSDDTTLLDNEMDDMNVLSDAGSVFYANVPEN
jgi:hypothetical protein